MTKPKTQQLLAAEIKLAITLLNIKAVNPYLRT